MASTKRDFSIMINIYTDGACSGNPGKGGWGVVILNNNKEILLNGGDQLTTNNKMELTAAIKALEYFETVSYTHLTLPTKRIV